MVQLMQVVPPSVLKAARQKAFAWLTITIW